MAQETAGSFSRNDADGRIGRSETRLAPNNSRVRRPPGARSPRKHRSGNWYKCGEDLSRERLHDIRDLTIMMRKRKLKPEKGRRKDVRKLDSLIRDLQSIARPDADQSDSQ